MNRDNSYTNERPPTEKLIVLEVQINIKMLLQGHKGM